MDRKVEKGKKRERTNGGGVRGRPTPGQETKIFDQVVQRTPEFRLLKGLGSKPPKTKDFLREGQGIRVETEMKGEG